MEYVTKTANGKAHTKESLKVQKRINKLLTSTESKIKFSSRHLPDLFQLQDAYVR